MMLSSEKNVIQFQLQKARMIFFPANLKHSFETQSHTKAVAKLVASKQVQLLSFLNRPSLFLSHSILLTSSLTYAHFSCKASQPSLRFSKDSLRVAKSMPTELCHLILSVLPHRNRTYFPLPSYYFYFFIFTL